MNPGNWWVHTRLVYLPMGYIYARRLSAPLTSFTQSLREELYVQPYDSINWGQQRNNVAKVDLYTPHTKVMDVLNSKLHEQSKESTLDSPAPSHSRNRDLLRKNSFQLELV